MHVGVMRQGQRSSATGRRKSAAAVTGVCGMRVWLSVWEDDAGHRMDAHVGVVHEDGCAGPEGVRTALWATCMCMSMSE